MCRGDSAAMKAWLSPQEVGDLVGGFSGHSSATKSRADCWSPRYVRPPRPHARGLPHPPGPMPSCTRRR